MRVREREKERERERERKREREQERERVCVRRRVEFLADYLLSPSVLMNKM